MSQTSLTAIRPAAAQMKPIEREIELKFLVGDSGFKASQQWALQGVAGRKPPARRLRSVYFDTAEGDLRRHQMVLRMRGQRRGYMMTLKWRNGLQGGLFERGEIEVASAHDTPELALFGPQAAAMIMQASQGRELAVVYATDIRRMTHLVRSATSKIEIAFDSGVIMAGEASLAVREIELELKGGDAADLYRLGILLAEQFPVRLGVLAKSDRGAMLAMGEVAQPVRAAAVLSGGMTLDEAIGRAMNGCLAQFVGNWPAFEAGDGVTAIHQMRVAMRRLRAMLGLFQRSFACPQFQAIREQARHIASVMGEARNLDVFMAMVRHGPLRAMPEEAGFAVILHDCEQRRQAAYAAVGALLSAAETTRFVLGAQAFIAQAGWRNALSPDALARLVMPAEEFARQNLARLHSKLLKRGKHLAILAPHQRHELRIDLKKLRYGADLFAPVFAGRERTRTYLKAAAVLQEQLGLFNDQMVAAEIVGQLETADSRAAGMILGWCSRGAMADDGRLRESWREFRKVKLFWA